MMRKLLLSLLTACVGGPAFANTCVPLQAGATDQTVYVEFIDSTTGVPTAALAFNEAGIDLEYVRSGAAAADITEATQTAGGAHSDGGFVSVGHGRYRLDLPDVAVAAGVTQVVVQGVITGYIMLPCTVALSPPVNAVALGGTAQTGRDIGASVLLSSGTGTGQISLTSGLLAWNPAWDAEVESEVDDSIGGGTGTSLTGIPWDADWDADVQSEVQDAIEANHLDHLLAATYDPASKPGAADALLNELVENAGGVSRFTTNALEQAPSGGGALTQADLGIHETTTTVTSQTVHVLASGSADDDAYNGFGAFFIDQSTATQVALGYVLDYDGGTTTVTLAADPGIFTIATGDTIILMPAFMTTGVDVETIEGVDATDQLDAHAAAGLDAAGVRAAVGLASANLDTQLTAIDDYVDTEVAAILVDTGTTLDAALAVVDGNVDAILVDTGTTLQAEVDGIEADVDAILVDTGTTLQAEVDGIQADTENIQTRIPAALNNGVMPSDVQRVNDVEITGDGSATPFNVP